MTIPVALQLYTVRDALAQNFERTVRRVAEIGYAGVEPAGFPGTTPREAAQLFQSLGLKVPSAHLPLPLGEEQGEVLNTAFTLGCARIVSSYAPPKEMDTLDGIKRVCERFNQASQVAVEQGLSFGIHNHWWEFEMVEDKPMYKTMLEELDRAIFWEIDTYWVKTAGLDPAEVLREFGERAPLLHIKDGPAVRDEPMVAVGQGALDFHKILEASAGNAEWLIVELDRCATDMMEAVEQSYHYLVEEGLGHGRER
jgi:sugar phosphate isomerase/epimerase